MRGKQFGKVKASDYAKQLAEKHDLDPKSVRLLLDWSIKNMCRMIERGEEIRVKRF